MYNMYLYAMYIHRRRRSKSVMLKYFAPAKYQQVFIFCIACVVVVVPTDRQIYFNIKILLLFC